MIIKEQSNDFEQPETGVYIARCVRLLDIGTHESEYQGQKNRRRQLVMSWELCNELMSDGKPFLVSKFYTMSLGEKANLRKDLINWRGRDFTPEELRGFELKNILGKPCQISITANDKGKRVVSGVTGLPKGMSAPEAFNPFIYFDLNDDWDAEAFEILPKGFQRMIQDSEEYKFLTNDVDDNHSRAQAAMAGVQLPNGQVMAQATDEDIPF